MRTYNALCASHILFLVTRPVHSRTISTPFLEHTALAAISALGTSRTHRRLCPTRYSFSPESSEACKGKVSCPRTQHRNNVPILRGEKNVIFLRILHQAGFETARQAATLAKLCALAIAPRYVSIYSFQKLYCKGFMHWYYSLNTYTVFVTFIH